MIKIKKLKEINMLLVVIICLLIICSCANHTFAQDTLLSEIRLEVPNDSGLHNAILAGNLIDGTVIMPDEEFSFNKVVGNRTRERGFANGNIVMRVNGEVIMGEGLGGGICRTSTALHQAVKKANLIITERHNHSMPVEYTVQGNDAAIYQDRWDYRFINNRSKPIRINIWTIENVIYVRIYEIVHNQISSEINRLDKLRELQRLSIFLNDWTLVPLESVSGVLGLAKCEFNNRIIKLVNQNFFITIKIGNSIGLFNGQPINIVQPVQIIQDRTMVSIRFIREIANLILE